MELQSHFFHATPLILASLKNHREIVQFLLLQPGIDINYKDIFMQSSFMKLDFFSH